LTRRAARWLTALADQPRRSSWPPGREFTPEGRAAEVRKPKPVIASELGISQSYVGSLLREARQRGWLGPGIPSEPVKKDDL
jgi:hypothetical protein